MGTCDNCFDGLHWRCLGKRGCTCSVCAGSDMSNRGRKALRRTLERPRVVPDPIERRPGKHRSLSDIEAKLMVADRDRGMSITQAAEKYRVSTATIKRYTKKVRSE